MVFGARTLFCIHERQTSEIVNSEPGEEPRRTPRPRPGGGGTYAQGLMFYLHV